MSKKLAISIVCPDVEISSPLWHAKAYRQIKSIQRAAKELGVELHSTFYVNKSNKHAKLQAIKELCVFTPKVRYLILDKPTRLSGDANKFANIATDFSEIDVEMYLSDKDEPDDDNSPHFKLAIDKAGTLASNEEHSERTKQGMKNMVEKGLYPFKPKLGYKASKTTGFCVRDGVIFEILQIAFKAVADRTLTPKEACQWLNSKWPIGTEKKPLQLSRWLNMLQDKYYAGRLRFGSSDEVIGLHEAMITEDEYYKIQEILTDSTRA